MFLPEIYIDMKKTTLFLLLVFVIPGYLAFAQELPELGAQVWIEPGDTDEEIDKWFRILSQHDMKTGRLFIMWNYIEPSPGVWDFSLYDKAFAAAEKNGINIIATLTTNRRSAHRGDYYQLHGHVLEDTRERLNESRIYIEKVVNHWKDHPALESWMLTNEASQSPSFHPLAIDRYKNWLAEKYGSIDELNSEWSTYFSSFDEIQPSKHWIKKGYWNWEPAFLDFHYFWQDHLSWWLEWIAKEVRKHDRNTDIHAHTGGITGNLADNSYDLPSWQEFTSTLGASIHPSWHFGLFERNQFPVAVSYCAELIRSASLPNPYWVTELQGGQNIFSGGPHPLTPTTKDIAQWTWISIGNDADRVIYWILNNRSKGFETNEWSMLDFQSNPNERLKTAGEIARILNQNPELFSKAEKYVTPVTILISLETMTHEKYAPDPTRTARSKDAHVLSVYGYYNTFLEMGIPVNIKHIHDFNWDSYSNHLVVLPHAIALSKEQADNITDFVQRGNKLLVSGLTGMVDETSESWVQREWPLKEVTGTDFKDCRLIGDSLVVELSGTNSFLNGVYWCGEVEPLSSEIIGINNGRNAAARNRYGSGEAVFIPTTLGLAAWIDDNRPLADFLRTEYHEMLNTQPVMFRKASKNSLIQLLKSDNKYIAVITNGNKSKMEAELVFSGDYDIRQLWGRSSALKGKNLELEGRETIVLIMSNLVIK